MLIIISTFILVVLFCLLLIWMWTWSSENRSSGWRDPTVKLKESLAEALTTTLGTTGVRTRIIFNGQEYSNVEEMPPEIRRSYQQAMNGVLADSNRNGIPDLFESGGANILHTEVVTRKPEDPHDTLKQLKNMRESGLITEQEYEKKKAEILARM